MTVTKSSNNSYTWRNAAGTSWGLYPEDDNFLAVGKDCPDYQKGYFFARFTKQGVFGPWLRFYERKGMTILTQISLISQIFRKILYFPYSLLLLHAKVIKREVMTIVAL